MHKALHPNDDIDRQYREGGKGFANIRCIDTMT